MIKMNKILLLIISATFTITAHAQQTWKGQWKSYSGDPKIEHRVFGLMDKMSLHDKLGQLTQFASPGELTTGSRVDPDMEEHIVRGEVGSVLNAFSLPVLRRLQKEAVEKSPLHIPILFGLDVVHGHTTVFPVPLAQSCSWNLPLIEQAEHIAAVETAASGVNWTFAPMVDVSRDPRWGRVVESAGEDAYLGSRIAVARVRGFQGHEGFGRNGIIACVKHFGGYGAAEGGRDYNTTDFSLQSLYNYYLRPYEAAAKAGAASFMSAFNDLNGVPCTTNRWLLTDVLRQRWGFRGMVVTDYTAIPELVNHGVVGDEKEAGEAALKAGVDMDMQGTVFLRFMERSVREGHVSEDMVNIACARVLELKFLLGLFDDPYRYMDEKYQKKTLLKPEFLAAARELARQSIVLLKNDGNLLPLDKQKVKTIALIGPYADPSTNVIGRWAGINMTAKYVSALEGITHALKGTDAKILTANGCDITGRDTTGFRQAVDVARQADVVLLLVGEGDMMNGEAQSRTGIQLPGVQQQLVSRVAATGRPTVMVLYNGRPMDITQPASEVSSVVDNWILGSTAGDALSDVLFGDYNPSGHLTMSFPRNVGQIPVYYNHKNTGRPIDPAKPFERYRSNYQDSVPNSPLYPFGYGMSYTSFQINNVSVDKATVANTDSVVVTCTVTNTGSREGTTVAQLYIRDMISCPTRPVAELAGFERCTLKAGESRHLSFTLRMRDLGIYNDQFQWQLPVGDMLVWVGLHAEDTANTVKLNITENR